MSEQDRSQGRPREPGEAEAEGRDGERGRRPKAVIPASCATVRRPHRRRTVSHDDSVSYIVRNIGARRMTTALTAGGMRSSSSSSRRC
jgi:hypothetical protein